MTIHKPDCAEVKHAADYAASLVSFEAEEKAYRDAWPNACEDCSGWGGRVSYYDPSPAGISLSPGFMADWEPCGTCVENDTCPRCGEKTVKLVEGTDAKSGLSDDHFECSACQWVEQKTEGAPLDMPEPPACDCWEPPDEDS